MSEQAPETTEAEQTEANEVKTSPDVVVTDDPGPAPDAAAEQTDSGESDTQDGDPASSDEAVSSDTVLDEE